MFFLSRIEYKLPIPPRLLSRPLADAVKEELDRIFLDKIIPDLGLCVTVYDIRSIDGGFIPQGDGVVIYEVVFRLVMFRPFIGEVIVGKIESSNANSLRVTLGFFSDIYIPEIRQQNADGISVYGAYRNADGIWVCNFEGVDGEYPIDLDEQIRFKVKSVKFPPIPVEQDLNGEPFAPMVIIGNIYGDGLGSLSWWGAQGEEEEEEEEEVVLEK
ncbi:hypothetical protein QJS10_CPB15g01928 [Acorus calamus]|uniref:DNA-directed RNA polymerase subunit n=1 Tax=Acorus calamus TaxID=4465 RepID=A0AAV9DB56_ACOCL|nr:hypothetical protein QJS10_CPB15g01928 [Acorus calamus]